MLGSCECTERGRTSDTGESTLANPPSSTARGEGQPGPGRLRERPARQARPLLATSGSRGRGPRAHHPPHKRAHEAEEPSVPGPRAQRGVPGPTRPRRSPAPTEEPRRGVARRLTGPPTALSRPENPVRCPAARPPAPTGNRPQSRSSSGTHRAETPPRIPSDARTRTASEDATTRPTPPRRPQFRGGARKRARALRRKSRPIPGAALGLAAMRERGRVPGGRAESRGPEEPRTERSCSGLRGPCAPWR